MYLQTKVMLLLDSYIEMLDVDILTSQCIGDSNTLLVMFSIGILILLSHNMFHVLVTVIVVDIGILILHPSTAS